MDQLHVATQGRKKSVEVIKIDGDDLVAVRREQRDGGIDDIREAGGSEEPARSSPERLVKWADVDAVKRLRKSRLARATPPGLAEDTRVGQRHIAGQMRRLQSDPHRSFVAFKSDESASIEHKAHADFARPVAGRFARTTTAPSRSARCCARISSAVISPNSCS